MEINFKNAKSRSFVKGLVVPSMWDESGYIMGISLSSFNEEIYLIENDEKGRELIEFLGEEVEIDGDLNADGHFNKITVNNFRSFDHS